MIIPSVGYHEEYSVRAYDIDAYKRMTAPALLRVLNELAMQHVLQLKLSVLDLEPHQIGWVLLRLEVDINRLPNLGEKIQVKTTPSGVERAYTYRDYYVTDKQGELLATASTTWIMLNTENRRPTRIPYWIMERLPEMPPPEQCLARPAGQLPDWTDATTQASSRVGWYDLDFNWHLSNTHYLGLLLNGVSSDFLKNHAPSHLLIHYKQEAVLDDELLSEACQMDGHSFRHRLRRGDDILAEASTSWRPITQ